MALRRPRRRLRPVVAAAIVGLLLLGAALLGALDTGDWGAAAAAGQAGEIGHLPDSAIAEPTGAAGPFPAPSMSGPGARAAVPAPVEFPVTTRTVPPDAVLPSVASDAGPSAAATPIEDTDWWTALEALDDRRAGALEAVDPAGLPSYAVVDSPAWRDDLGLLAALEQAGTRPLGVRSDLIAIESALWCPDGRSACLEIVDQRRAYTLVDGNGDVVQEVGQAPVQRWRLTLVPIGRATAAEPGWRISEAVPLT